MKKSITTLCFFLFVLFQYSISQDYPKLINIEISGNYDSSLTSIDLKHERILWSPICSGEIILTFDKESTFSFSDGSYSQTGNTFSYSTDYLLPGTYEYYRINSLEGYVADLELLPTEKFIDEFQFYEDGFHIKGDTLFVNETFNFRDLNYVFENPYALEKEHIKIGSNSYSTGIHGSLINAFPSMFINDINIGNYNIISDFLSGGIAGKIPDFQDGDQVFMELEALYYESSCGVIQQGSFGIRTQTLVVKKVSVIDQINTINCYNSAFLPNTEITFIEEDTAYYAGSSGPIHTLLQIDSLQPGEYTLKFNRARFNLSSSILESLPSVFIEPKIDNSSSQSLNFKLAECIPSGFNIGFDLIISSFSPSLGYGISEPVSDLFSLTRTFNGDTSDIPIKQPTINLYSVYPDGDYIHIDLDQAERTGDGKIKVPVKYQSTNNYIVALDYTLYYNQELITILKVEKSDYSISENLRLSHNVRENDLLVTSYIAPANAPIADTIVQFILLKDIIKIEALEFGNGVGYINGIQKELRVTGSIKDVLTSTNDKRTNDQHLINITNPITDRIKLLFPESIPLDSKIILFDSNGRILYQKILTKDNSRVSIPCQEWSKGMYYFTWVNKDGYLIQRDLLTK